MGTFLQICRNGETGGQAISNSAKDFSQRMYSAASTTVRTNGEHARVQEVEGHSQKASQNPRRGPEHEESSCQIKDQTSDVDDEQLDEPFRQTDSSGQEYFQLCVINDNLISYMIMITDRTCNWQQSAIQLTSYTVQLYRFTKVERTLRRGTTSPN